MALVLRLPRVWLLALASGLVVAHASVGLRGRSSYPIERVAGGCPPIEISTRGWVDFVLSDAPASFRVPPDTAGIQIMPVFQDVWIGRGWKLRVDVGKDSAELPLGGAEGPFPVLRTQRIACVDTVDGRPMRIAMYRQHAGDVHGDFVVTAVWPLLQGSWLRIGGVAVDTGAQHLLADIVRTLRFDTAGRLQIDRRPSLPCPRALIDTTGWSRIRLSYAPVTLLLPAGGQTHWQVQPPVESLEWPRGRTVLNYRLLATPGWQLPKPTDSSWTWCSFSVAGGKGGIRIVRVRGGLPRMYEERASISFAPGEVVDLRGEVLRADSTALNQFIAVITSIREQR